MLGGLDLARFRRYFYRFSDPIFQPYVILNGLSQSLITDDQLLELQLLAKTKDGPVASETDSPQRLF